VRQIALARLALSRMNLDGWLADQQRRSTKHYRATGPVCDTEIEPCDGAPWLARTRRMTRLTRFFFLRALPARWSRRPRTTKRADRLVILESNDDALARKMAQTVGISAKEASYAVASEHDRSKMTREDALSARPKRLVEAAAAREIGTAARRSTFHSSGRAARWANWLLRVPGRAPPRRSSSTRSAVRLAKLRRRHERAHDRRESCEEVQLNLREAEVPTVQFLQTLMRKGLLGIETLDQADDSAAHTSSPPDRTADAHGSRDRVQEHRLRLGRSLLVTSGIVWRLHSGYRSALVT
jgi:hypothetical protein